MLPFGDMFLRIVTDAILKLTAKSNEGGYEGLVREGERTGMSRVWEYM